MEVICKKKFKYNHKSWWILAGNHYESREQEDKPGYYVIISSEQNDFYSIPNFAYKEYFDEVWEIRDRKLNEVLREDIL